MKTYEQMWESTGPKDDEYIRAWNMIEKNKEAIPANVDKITRLSELMALLSWLQLSKRIGKETYDRLYIHARA